MLNKPKKNPTLIFIIRLLPIRSLLNFNCFLSPAAQQLDSDDDIDSPVDSGDEADDESDDHQGPPPGAAGAVSDMDVREPFDEDTITPESGRPPTPPGDSVVAAPNLTDCEFYPIGVFGSVFFLIFTINLNFNLGSFPFSVLASMISREAMARLVPPGFSLTIPSIPSAAVPSAPSVESVSEPPSSTEAMDTQESRSDPTAATAEPPASLSEVSEAPPTSLPVDTIPAQREFLNFFP